MTNVTIYTNGKKLFTLENYSKTAGVSFENGITKHSEVSKLKAMAMHSNGQLAYVFGIGDRKVLTNENRFKRNTTLGNFNIK